MLLDELRGGFVDLESGETFGSEPDEAGSDDNESDDDDNHSDDDDDNDDVAEAESDKGVFPELQPLVLW